WNLQPQALQDICQGLRCKYGLLTVTGPFESNHDSVTDQRIVPHAFDRGDVANQDPAILLAVGCYDIYYGISMKIPTETRARKNNNAKAPTSRCRICARLKSLQTIGSLA